MKIFSRAILTALATSKPTPTSCFAFSNKVYYPNSEHIMMKHIDKFSTRLFSAASTADLDDLTVTLDGPDLPSIASGSKRLFLVRHGEVINPGGDRPVYYGCMDVKLSGLGEKEAKAAGAYLKQFDVQNIASSPLTRAKFGANEVLKRQESKDKEILIFEGFTEMDRGAWVNLTLDEIGKENMEAFDRCDLSVTPEGGESYPGLKERVLKARDELLEATEVGQASAVISHLQVTRSMLSDALGIPVDEMSTLKVATASITCIDFDESGEQTVHFQSFKPDAGLRKSVDGAN
ncbi:hypothetical protein CTEN210_08592 [Chaetoceros tenuissimus]|uniref:Phosphoglycerate mutase (2,3-diphosphoglycerate-dependent) n=1 Tax=Chaetoceros tenuissimus TaxID=426638 RepID=A0AAD3CVV7_9STRA|nr:hypothetical protein CTEN210_08592 [Chaetoceros tenuissimus]